MRSPYRTRSRRPGCPRGSSPRSRCARSPSPTSGAGPFATSRRGGWWCSRRAPAIHSSPRIPRGGPPRGGGGGGAPRAVEIGAAAILKATKVDGIYPADPAKDRTAVRLPRVGYIEVLNRGLQVMDTTAISLCMDNKLPIVVFDLTRKGNIRRIVTGEPVGSVVSADAGAPKGGGHDPASGAEGAGDAGAGGQRRAG